MPTPSRRAAQCSRCRSNRRAVQLRRPGHRCRRNRGRHRRPAARDGRASRDKGFRCSTWPGSRRRAAQCSRTCSSQPRRSSCSPPDRHRRGRPRHRLRPGRDGGQRALSRMRADVTRGRQRRRDADLGLPAQPRLAPAGRNCAATSSTRPASATSTSSRRTRSRRRCSATPSTPIRYWSATRGRRAGCTRAARDRARDRTERRAGGGEPSRVRLGAAHGARPGRRAQADHAGASGAHRRIQASRGRGGAGARAVQPGGGRRRAARCADRASRAGLVAYRDRAYADRYRRLVDRVRAAEGERIGVDAGFELTEAVARYFSS